jgi:hypothetical protein
MVGDEDDGAVDTSVALRPPFTNLASLSVVEEGDGRGALEPGIAHPGQLEM